MSHHYNHKLQVIGKEVRMKLGWKGKSRVVQRRMRPSGQRKWEMRVKPLWAKGSEKWEWSHSGPKEVRSESLGHFGQRKWEVRVRPPWPKEVRSESLGHFGQMNKGSLACCWWSRCCGSCIEPAFLKGAMCKEWHMCVCVYTCLPNAPVNVHQPPLCLSMPFYVPVETTMGDMSLRMCAYVYIYSYVLLLYKKAGALSIINLWRANHITTWWMDSWWFLRM